MNRDIKFRAWGPNTKYMWSWEEFKHCFVHAMFDPEHGEKILMQYTGLKDKNGKEIYEGDIVVTKGTSMSGKKWDHKPKTVVFDPDYGYCLLKSSLITDVIGNIYENPELLEGLKT